MHKKMLESMFERFVDPCLALVRKKVKVNISYCVVLYWDMKKQDNFCDIFGIVQTFVREWGRTLENVLNQLMPK